MRLQNITGINPEIRTFEKSDLLPSNDFIGLEIEVEDLNNLGSRDLKSKFWEIKEDPSLRNNGREFAYVQPLNGKDIEVSLNQFRSFVEWYEHRHNKISCSERTSIHVHCDVRDFTHTQLLNFSLLFMTFEPLLFKVFGTGREDSNYCLPLYKSTDRFRLSKLTLNDPDDIRKGIDGSKYSAFNTAPVRNLGSVEIRLHYGTIDTDEILNWIAIILHMKKYARTMEWDSVRYPDAISSMGVDNFLSSVFEERASQLTYPGFHQDLWDGVRVAQDTTIRQMLEKDHKKGLNLEKNKTSKRFKSFTENNKLGIKKEIEKEKVSIDPDTHTRNFDLDPLTILLETAGIRPGDPRNLMSNNYGMGLI